MKTRPPQLKYTVVIQWSEEDHCYIASLPEWANRAIASASGKTYEEAARNACEVLELLMEDEFGKPVDAPRPRLFRYSGAGVTSRSPGAAAKPLRSRASTKPARQTV